jgi:AcrR family transcriptional regulator
MIVLISAGWAAKAVNRSGVPPGAATFSGMTAEGDARPPRRRNPRGAGERLHDELVEAAVRVLAAHGDTERLSIRAVAAEAQVTPPAVYRHFPDRRALVRTAVETCFGRFEIQLALAEQGATGPFEALRRRCRAYVAFGAAQPHLYRVMFGAWSAGPSVLGTYGRRPHPGAGAFTALIDSIQRCLNAGAQTRRSSPFLAFQLWSLLHGMTDLRAGKPEMPWPGSDEMIDNFLVCMGLRAPSRPTA